MAKKQSKTRKKISEGINKTVTTEDIKIIGIGVSTIVAMIVGLSTLKVPPYLIPSLIFNIIFLIIIVLQFRRIYRNRK